MGSTRLPGKSLAMIGDMPLLSHVIQRLKEVKNADKIIVATTTSVKDAPIVELAKKEGVEYFCGSEDDVLDRYYQAAKKFNAEILVRITADCPLLDPEVVDNVINAFINGKFDYVSNTNPPTYPDGLDVEVFSFTALETAWKEAKLTSEREHVTPYIWKHPEKFRLFNVINDIDLSRMRWTVDEKEDLEFVRKVYSYLKENKKVDFSMEAVLRVLSERPEFFLINKRFTRNEGYAKSVNEDKKIK